MRKITTSISLVVLMLAAGCSSSDSASSTTKTALSAAAAGKAFLANEGAGGGSDFAESEPEEIGQAVLTYCQDLKVTDSATAAVNLADSLFLTQARPDVNQFIFRQLAPRWSKLAKPVCPPAR